MTLESTSASGCTPTARVFVGNTEVPWVNNEDGDGGVETQMRKTGVAGITKFSDVHIPLVWGGDDVINEISTPDLFSPPSGIPSLNNLPVRIDLYDTVTEQYVPIHQGPITATGTSQLEGCFRIHVTDWANYLQTISADVTFSNPKVWNAFVYVSTKAKEDGRIPPLGTRVPNANVKIFGRNEVDNYFGTEEESDSLGGYFNTDEVGDIINMDGFVPDFSDGLLGDGLFGGDGIQEERNESIFDTDEFDDIVNIEKIAKDTAELLFGNADDLGKSLATRSFNEFEHSVTDVLDWICKLEEAQWYVDYDILRNKPFLTFDPTPSSALYETHSLNSDPNSGAIAISNNALFQLSPQHTIGVRGQANTDFQLPNSANGWNIQNQKKPQAVVEYEPLVDRVGYNPNPKYTEINTNDLAPTKKAAKSELKSLLDGASGGEIIAKPFAMADPFTRIRSKPTCSGRIARDVDSITYEVQEVIHDIATDTQRHDGPKTIMRCGLHVDKEKMNIRDASVIQM